MSSIFQLILSFSVFFSQIFQKFAISIKYTHKTIDFIKNELDLIGVECRDFGRCGLAAEIGNKKDGKVILLRADIDALPIKEESGEEFS